MRHTNNWLSDYPEITEHQPTKLIMLNPTKLIMLLPTSCNNISQKVLWSF